MKHRKSVLSATIVACLGFAVQVQAQEAADAPTTQEATELDGVVVVGIRGALQQSLETKRNSDSIIDVITAEDVGKFPATNVAEAMVLIPGVSIDKAFGQGERVSIMGTDPALSRTLLNGQTMASADWYFGENPGRSFNYALLAPQLVGKVEVYKSPEAHIDEGSIGGTVIVSTRKPLDMTDPFTMSGQIGYLYNDRIGTGEPKASFVVGWKNDAGNFGIMASAQRDIESIRRDGVESHGTMTGRNFAYGMDGAPGSVYNLPIDWSLPPDGQGNWQTYPPSCAVGACQDTLLNNLDARAPRTLSAHYFTQERKRDTLSLSLQFRPHENLDIEFNALDVKAGYDHTANSLMAFQGNPYNGLGRLTGLTVDGGVITQATFKNALTMYELIDRRSTVESDSYDVKATWNDERWFASAHVGTTQATGGTGQHVNGSFLNWADYSYDISGDTPKLTFHGTNPFIDPSAYRIDGGYANPWHTDPPSETNWAAGWGGTVSVKPTRDEEKYGQFDFGIRLDSPIYQMRFGLKNRRHETGQTSANVVMLAVQGYGDATADMFNPRPLPGNYLRGFGDAGDLSTRFAVDGWAVADYIVGGEWRAPWQPKLEPDPFSSIEAAAQNWTIKEDINAAYMQADYSWNGLRGNVGFRYVQTETESIGWQCSVNPCDSIANNGAHTFEQVNNKRRYSDFLPNLNVAYDWNDVVFRFSAAKVISRPNYGDMSNYLWLNPTGLTGGGGNPDLDPYRSTNLDFSAEWYFKENAILAGSLFHKDIGNYILVTTGTERHFNEREQRESDFTISRPRNAGSASVQGLSLAYQQDLVHGFGILANYTYSDATSDNGMPVPWTSEHQYSLSPFFENDSWSARVTYSHRSDYFTNVDRGNNMVTDGYTSLDATVSFRLNDYLSIALDGLNLLDSEYYSYAQVPGVANTKKLIGGSYRTGRRYLASLRVRF